jgi:GTPase SAR1 family protein
MPPGRSTATDADPRIQGFLGVTIAHPHLKRAENDLRLRIRQPAGAALVLLCGPTGVGKTTLIERTIRETNRELLPTLEADPDRLGIVSLRVMASEVSTFSWRDLYLRTLHALAEPFAGDVPAGMITEKELQSMKRQRATVADVRERLISVLRVRRPAAVVWDESQHIALNLRSRMSRAY